MTEVKTSAIVDIQGYSYPVAQFSSLPHFKFKTTFGFLSRPGGHDLVVSWVICPSEAAMITADSTKTMIDLNGPAEQIEFLLLIVMAPLWAALFPAIGFASLNSYAGVTLIAASFFCFLHFTHLRNSHFAFEEVSLIGDALQMKQQVMTQFDKSHDEIVLSKPLCGILCMLSWV